eukprot:TRINITY_DN12265_c0_g1_i2.p1 TRINITY_DN12265_c0_g1~~TRINITY_DN12265_c0_g1_i2.p1  ORF type:complete len:217 (+),score=73.59 TRINITY_DN12265_c0_g1_i2:108-758(+)
MECEQMIARLGLHDHPEGGHYKVTWRSEGTIPCGQVQPTSRYYLNEQWEGEAAKPEEVRHLSGAILFLLRGSQISRFHKLRSEEQWFFHATGSTPESKASLVIHTINEESGEYAAKRVGMNFDAGDEFQQFVTPGHWFGATVEPSDPERWILVGCVVAPAFDFSDFIMHHGPDALLAKYPQHRDIIARLSPVINKEQAEEAVKSSKERDQKEITSA